MLRDALSFLVVAAAIILVVTNLWVTVLQIDGSSMNPLLKMDEIILALKTDNPSQNDVIVFSRNEKIYVKRVIAMAGDWVNIDDDGIVTVNGTILEEPYVSELSVGVCDINFPYQVPAGSVFVMGDNRPLSKDSRDSQFGSVSREQIAGKVVMRAWPPSRIGFVS